MKKQIFLILTTIIIGTESIAQVDLNAGLVAYYPLDGNANDLSGNNLHGTMKNGPVATMDNRQRPNSALYFDGINDYVEIPDHALLRFKNEFSITFLFNRDPSSLTAELIEKREWSTGAKSSFDIGLVDGGKVRTAIKVGKNCSSPEYGWIYPTVSEVTQANTWYCVAAIFNNGKLDFYFNGNLVGTSTSSFNSVDECIGSTIRLGMHLEFDKLPFKGIIDEVRLYDRALNTDEIGSLCLIDKPPVLCSGSLGDPVINIDFGKGPGSARPLETIVPGAEISLAYQPVNGNPSTPAPTDGYYTITNNIPSHGGWFSGKLDHTPGDTLGNMLFINAGETPGKFYQQTITGLCGNVTYEFSCWVANVLNDAVNKGIEPDLAFIIERTDGTPIASYQTGGIPQTSQMQWKQFGFLFQTPNNVNSVVVKIFNNNIGGLNNPGNDLAIDDITFRACRPLLTASLDQNNMKDSAGYCAGTSIELFGKSFDNNPNTEISWQMKKNDEKEWQQMLFTIPGIYSFTLPISESSTVYYFRMVSVDANNRNSPYCMAASNVIEVTSLQLPIARFNVKDVCKGEPSEIIMEASTGSFPYSIKYTDGQTNFALDQLLEKDTIIQFLESSTMFRFTYIRDKFGCETNVELARIIAVVNPSPTITFSPIIPVCENEHGLKQLEFSVSSNTNGISAFSDDRINADGQFKPSEFGEGAYPIKYSFISENGCTAEEIRVLNVFPAPVTRGTIDLIACKDQQLQLNVSGGTKYQWTPTSGISDPTIPNPLITINGNTLYTVRIENDEGCYAVDTFKITSAANATSNFKLPNAFSPNGDGKNDCFGIRHWGLVNIEQFRIFNRWGQIVFETKTSTDCWDGRFYGKPQPPGSYVYLISCTTPCGPLKTKGIIHLIK